jgi:type II secretory pathway pseudopilin PulG
MDSKLTQKGFTLIEVLVMTVLLAMAFLVFLGSLNLGRDLQNKSEVKSVQAILLHDLQEQIKSRRFDENLIAPWSGDLGTDVQENSNLIFDGSNDFVTLPDFSYLNDITFSGWIKIHTRNNWERIFDFGKGGSGDMFLTVQGGRTGGDLEMTLHPNPGAYSIDPGVTLEDSQWHHIVFTYDKGGAGMKLYIDGALTGSNIYNIKSFSDWGNGQNFYLGKANWNDPYFDGEMDEVSIFSIAITSEEVTSIYNGGQNADLRTSFGDYQSAQNLVGYWKMNEGSGTVISDLSPFNNNAFLNGVSWGIGSGGSEISLSDFDDVDDFKNYQITQYADHPAFGAQVYVEYVNWASKFRVVSTTPTEYKRVVVNISHSSFSTLTDTLIIGAGL